MTKQNNKLNTEEENTTTAAEATEEVQTESTTKEVSNADATVVTSDATLDFPSLGWGIHAGEERDLPDDADARKAILSNPHISVIK